VAGGFSFGLAGTDGAGGSSSPLAPFAPGSFTAPGGCSPSLADRFGFQVRRLVLAGREPTPAGSSVASEASASSTLAPSV